ncbi:MAG: CHAT domain-containing protein [Acidobacteriota bacterium]|nr:CHAT domain-containing protein [Acidobacteriota bacterium]
MTLAQLTVEVFPAGENRFGVCLDFYTDNSQAPARLTREGAGCQLDPARLEVLNVNPERYGKTLRDAFFADPALRSAFAAGRARAAALNRPLRVRLCLDAGVSHLHALAWETLFDPEGNRPLFMGEDIFFSRHLTGQNWQPVTISRNRAFRALVAIASPNNLHDYGMPHLDVEQEQARAEAGLAGIETRVLPSGGAATLENILAVTRNDADILYLVCHGMLRQGESWLLLEDETGGLARVRGGELAERLAAQKNQPRLVVLVSCNSAAQEGEDVATALGPQLAASGIPAVLAMRGKVSMPTMLRFLPTFFSELQRDGFLDRAMAVARGAVRDRPDWGMPVLFSRLIDGRLWEEKEEEAAVLYDALLWHHPNDFNAVEEFARRLEDEAQVKPWLAAWHLLPGDNPNAVMAGVCARGATLVAVMGPSGLGPWLNVEQRDVLAAALARGKARVVPLLLPGAGRIERESDLPGFLRRRIWATLDEDETPEALEQTVRAIRGQPAGRPATTDADVCPFRGLEVFREEDRGFFFGREAVTQRLHEHMMQHHFLAVLGPSGSGKSSVVQAGLIPLLHREGFQPVLFTPAASPCEELAFALAPLFETNNRPAPPTGDLVERLNKREEELHYLIRELGRSGNSDPVCLVIDQFEEIFTLARDQDEVAKFLAGIWYALEHPSEDFAVVLTMRSDFLGKCAVWPDLDDYITEHMIQIKPMTQEELRRAVEEPARLTGLRFEAGLVDRMLEDLEGAAGELPLLEHALLELYERRRGKQLTSQAYSEIGGIEGALAKRAEGIYANLDEPGRKALAKMFTLCLIHPGEGAEDTRRRATREELSVAAGSRGDELLELLTDARLLTSSVDEARNLVQIDVAHEALIRKWDRIKIWMAEGRDTARLLNQLRARTKTWMESGRHEDYLIHGGQLVQIREVAEREKEHIGALELQYVKECVAMVTRDARKRRMVRNVMAVLAVLGTALAAIAFSLFRKADEAGRRALEEKARVVQQTKEANYNLALAYRMSAGNALENGQPNQARLFALAGLSQDIPEARELPEPGTLFFDPRMSAGESLLFVTPALPELARVTASGQHLLLAGKDRVIRVMNANGVQTAVLSGPRQEITDLAASPDGQWAAAATGGEVVHLWQLTQNRYTALANEEKGRMHKAAFSPDGQWLAAGGEDGWVAVYPLSGNNKPYVWGLRNGVQDLVFDAAGKKLLIATGNRIARMDPRSGKWQTLPQAHGEAITTLALTTDGLLVSGDEAGKVVFRDSRSGKLDNSQQLHGGPVLTLAASVDGTQLVSTARDEILFWDSAKRNARGLAISGSLISAAMDPNGKLLGCRADGTLLSSDQSGNSVLEAVGHADAVAAVDFSPDGKTIATASLDHTVQLWDLNGKKRPQILREHTGAVLDVAISPDGKLLAAASTDRTATLWSIAEAKRLETFADHEDIVSSVAFSPDGKTLVTASFDGTVRLRPLDGSEAETLNLGQGKIGHVTFSKSGDLLAVTSGDHTVLLRPMETGEPSSPLRGHTKRVAASAFAPDDRRLATASYDQTVIIWDVRTKQKVDQLTDHAGPVTDVQYSADGKHLVTSSNDRTVIIWDVYDNGSVWLNKLLRGHAGDVLGAAFAPDGRIVASVSLDKTMRLWDVRPTLTQPVLEGHTGKVHGGGFTADGNTFVSASSDKTLRTWSLNGETTSKIIAELDSPGTSAAVTRDGAAAVAGGEDGTVYLWREETGRTRSLKGHKGPVNDVVFSPDGSRLASASSDNTVKLWSAADPDQAPQTLTGHTDHVLAVAFSPDGLTAASGSLDKSARLWDLEGKRAHRTLSGHTEGIYGIAFSPDGRYAATASLDHTAVIWDLETGESKQRLRGHTDYVMGVAFHPEGNLIATSSADQTVRIWDNERGRQLGILRGHQGPVLKTIAFSPNGNFLATPSADTTVRLWQTNRFPMPPTGADPRDWYLNLLNRSLSYLAFRIDRFNLAHLPVTRLYPIEGDETMTILDRSRPLNQTLTEWLTMEK